MLIIFGIAITIAMALFLICIGLVVWLLVISILRIIIMRVISISRRLLISNIPLMSFTIWPNQMVQIVETSDTEMVHVFRHLFKRLLILIMIRILVLVIARVNAACDSYGRIRTRQVRSGARLRSWTILILSLIQILRLRRCGYIISSSSWCMLLK